jgi:hypothetical protein
MQACSFSSAFTIQFLNYYLHDTSTVFHTGDIFKTEPTMKKAKFKANKWGTGRLI